MSAIALGIAAAYPVHADEINSLKEAIARMSAEMEALKQRQMQLEARPPEARSASAPMPMPEPAADARGVIRAGDMPGSFKFPGTNTSVRLGGYIDLTATKDLGVNMGGTFILPSQIPLPGSPTADRKGQFYMNARRSRLDVTTLTPTRLGDVGTVLQGDFYGAGGNEAVTNSYAFRLRLAYATVGRWTLGQDWSTMFDLPSSVDILDFGGGIGAPSGPRQGLVRYTLPLTPASNLALALENPESDVFNVATNVALAGTSPVPSQTIDKSPDFVARYTTMGPWGRLAVAGVARRLTLNNQGTAAVGGFTGEQSRTTSTFMLQGRLNAFGGDSLQYSLLAGDGIGRYMVDSTSPTAYVDPDDQQLKLIRGKGVSLGYTHRWTSTLRSNLVWMGADYDLRHSRLAGGIPLTAISRTQLLFANLIWTPTPYDFVAVEATRAVVRADGIVAPVTSNKQTANRLQFSYRRVF